MGTDGFAIVGNKCNFHVYSILYRIISIC
jgi:hypothetical protein